MLKYVTVGANDLARSIAFYDATLAPLGIVRLKTIEREAGYGPQPGPGAHSEALFWVLTPFNGQPATFGNGVDIAFEAKGRGAVDAFHAAALANGGSDEGGPGLRPHYSPTFYSAYVRDPDGNKINAVFERSLHG